MDAGKATQSLSVAAMCTLCWEFLKDPVTLDCGHNYCTCCITAHWNGPRGSCPQCKATSAGEALRPNSQLGDLALLLKQLELQGVTIMKKQDHCETHHQPLVLFCRDDETFLCSGCDVAQAHSGHWVSDVELAAQEYKYEIRVLLDVQKHQRESIRASSAVLRQEKQNLVRLMEEGVQKLSSECKELLDLVRTVQAEQFSLARQIEKEIEEELSNFSKKRSNLKKLNSELQKKCELPAHEFLKGIKQAMSKCREEAYQPMESAPPEVTEKLWDFSRRNLFLQNTLRRCRGALLLKPKVERAILTMDPLTAFSQLLVSEDRKRVIHEPLVYSPVTDPLGFNTAPCVLAAEGFTMGRHCWEVEIISEGKGWALGLAKESVQRKGAITLGHHPGVWALQPECSALLSHKSGTTRVRVYLHYEAGQLEFFDASSRDLLVAFQSLCFLGEKVFPFFMVEEQHVCIKLCF